METTDATNATQHNPMNTNAGIAQWAAVKSKWNEAWLSACWTATAVSQEIKAQCGQDVCPGALLRELSYKVHYDGRGRPEYRANDSDDYIAAQWDPWGAPQPVELHWDGTIAQFTESCERLQEATPERLHLIAAEILMR